MNWNNTRGQLMDGAPFVFGLIVVVLAMMLLIFDTVRQQPKDELQAVMNATPWWQTAIIVIALSVIVALIYPVPHIQRGDDD